MMLRLVFTLETGEQLLVTVEGDNVTAAVRAESWHSWARPLDLDYADDDSPEPPEWAVRA